MLRLEVIKKELINVFSVLSSCVEGYNNIGYFDINHDLEDIVKDILNIINYGNYINCNDYEKNSIGIDLIDKNTNTGIQVTSDQSLRKIKDSLRKSNAVKTKFVYLSVRKVKHKIKNENFDSDKDILNFIDLIQIAKTNSKLDELYEYVKCNNIFDNLFNKYYLKIDSNTITDVSLKDVIFPFKDLNDYILNILYYDKKIDIRDTMLLNMAEIINWVIGNRNFPISDVISFYKLYNKDNLNVNKDILNSRRNALISYYSGDLNKCSNIYNRNFNKVLKSDLSSWIKNDFLIDGRNILNKIDYSYFYSYKNKFQKEIRDNNITITYPFIDRIEKNILNTAIDKVIKYKYKDRRTKMYGFDLSTILNNIQSIIYISIIYGSITQLNLVREIIKNVLILFADAFNDIDLYKEGLKFYVLTCSFKDYKNIVKKLNVSDIESDEYVHSILNLREVIDVYYKNDFDIFVFDYYGRVLSDEEFLVYENRILDLLERKENINNALKSLPSNLIRINNKNRLFKVLKSMVPLYTRGVEEVIEYIKYEELNNENKEVLKDIISIIISNNQYSLITDLLIDIKKIDNTSIYDDILNKNDDDKLYCKLNMSGFNIDNLELVVDEMIRRNDIVIRTGINSRYQINYYILSDYFKEDTPKLRKIIESKLLHLCFNSLSSKNIEYDEKIKLLKSLIFIHYFDGKYDFDIKNILDNIVIESEESFFEEYNDKNIEIYIYALKYILKEITILDLLNNYMIVMNEEYLFSDISFILYYILSREDVNEYVFNIVFVFISIMLKSDKLDNRISAIELSKVLYNSIYFDNLYNSLEKISIESKYDKIKALIRVIKSLDSNELKISKLKENILNNRNYNIRYMGNKYLN